MFKSSRLQKQKMTPMFSLAHLTVLDCTVPELVYIAARAGYDAISPRLIRMGVADESPHYFDNREMMHATESALKITGIKVQQIELATITNNCDVASYEPMFAAGERLGATSVITSAWTSKDTSENYVAEKYAQICDLAKKYGMSAALEFPTFSYINTLEKAVEIIRAVEKPNATLLVDTLYTHFSRTKFSSLKNLPNHLCEVVHVCDSSYGIPDTQEGMKQIARNSRLYMGEGCIDLLELVGSLPPVHFDIELPNKSRVQELGYEEHARRCLVSTKKTLSSMPNKQMNYVTYR